MSPQNIKMKLYWINSYQLALVILKDKVLSASAYYAYVPDSSSILHPTDFSAHPKAISKIATSMSYLKNIF